MLSVHCQPLHEAESGGTNSDACSTLITSPSCLFGTKLQVPASAVSIGQHVLVRPGEQVPLDGVIVWGTANLSLQHITGEEQPVKLSPGQDVPAGSLSTDGLLVVRVEATAEDSTPARIARLAAEAQVCQEAASTLQDTSCVTMLSIASVRDCNSEFPMQCISSCFVQS